MKIRTLIVAVATLMGCSALSAQNFVPLPREVTISGDNIEFTPRSKVYTTDSTLTEYLRFYFPKAETAVIQNGQVTLSGRSKGAIVAVVVSNDMQLPDEGYTIMVDKSSNLIMVKGKGYAGAFNGIQTLLQLFPPQVYKGGFRSRCTIPCMTVRDWPEYSYRGQHLDVARTFSTATEVMNLIDNLSHFKINKLHWHLTDDEGWRIEIRSHPELASVGGFRGGDSPLKAIYGKYDERYGGYYTQEEIRRIVDYATVRNVEVIPEIDLPGHSSTAGKIYPEILCPTGEDFTAAAGVDQRNVWCVAREENYALLDDILCEVAELFPSKYIHIGGDEVNMNQWQRCPHCSALYAEKGYTDYHQLEGLFMCRLNEILGRYGRSAAVWNEAVNGGNLPKTTRVHGWENLDVCHKATAEGFETVVMPSPYFYFDMRQSSAEEGMYWAGTVDIAKTYSLNLAAEGFTPEQLANVVGFEGAFWTELYLHNRESNPEYLEYQIFPRALATAELGWTPTAMRSADDFTKRLEDGAFPRMNALGIAYRAKAPVRAKEQLLTPTMTFTSSMPFRRDNACEQISNYRNDFGHPTARTCLDGDWLLFTFDTPLSCSKIRLITGYRYMARSLFPSGYVEVSFDGEHFQRAAELHDGRVELENLTNVVAVRVVSTSHGNGNSYVYIQYPEIIR